MPLAHQFDDLEQQHEAEYRRDVDFPGHGDHVLRRHVRRLWVYRNMYPEAWAMASRHTNFLIGTVNTVVLIASSLMVVLALHSAQTGKRKPLILFLALTILLGCAFLGLKGVEYYEHYEDHLLPGHDFVFEPAHAPAAALFMCFYFAMTGVHALHMIVGIGLMIFLLVWAYLGRITPEHPAHVEVIGLYWHFVDIVWIFLYPLIYL